MKEMISSEKGSEVAMKKLIDSKIEDDAKDVTINALSRALNEAQADLKIALKDVKVRSLPYVIRSEHDGSVRSTRC